MKSQTMLERQLSFCCTNSRNKMTNKVYETDGPEAKEIARYLPYFPFKGIPRFYDIGGFLANPEVFQKIVDIFASRYDDIGIDSVAGCVVGLETHMYTFSFVQKQTFFHNTLYPPLNSVSTPGDSSLDH